MHKNSDLANFYYYPTDCPHREKNGWTGDAWLSAEHMLLNFTFEISFREWLYNVRCAQNLSGEIPGIIPTNKWRYDWGFGPVWDAVCVQIPYSLYKYTGDVEVIKENAPMIMRYIEFLSSKCNEHGLIDYGLGDWCDPFQEEKGYISSPTEVTSSIATYDIINKATFLFKQAGLQRESIYARLFAKEIRKNIRKQLIDFESMTVKGDCQTSQALGIAMGIFDKHELDKARRRLVEIIYRDGEINTCGVYGIRYIYHVLSEMDEAELAYKIITSRERSCYGYWIENGATSLWESFKEVDSFDVDSRNHHFLEIYRVGLFSALRV